MYVSSQAWESSEFLHFQRFGHQPFEGEKKISVEDFFFSLSNTLLAFLNRIFMEMV